MRRLLLLAAPLAGYTSARVFRWAARVAWHIDSGASIRAMKEAGADLGASLGRARGGWAFLASRAARAAHRRTLPRPLAFYAYREALRAARRVGLLVNPDGR